MVHSLRDQAQDQGRYPLTVRDRELSSSQGRWDANSPEAARIAGRGDVLVTILLLAGVLLFPNTCGIGDCA